MSVEFLDKNISNDIKKLACFTCLIAEIYTLMKFLISEVLDVLSNFEFPVQNYPLAVLLINYVLCYQWHFLNSEALCNYIEKPMIGLTTVFTTAF